jgi:dienelactone hydrolase
LSRSAPFFFGPPDSTLFGVLDQPAPGSSLGLGVVINTSIGNDGVIAHRSLRVLGQQLASAGLPTLRFDPPATGDSTGQDDDPDRIAGWRESIGQAAAELKRRTGVSRVAVIGVRLGAMMAVSAVDAGLEVAALVLWDPPPSGKRWLRDERVYHRLARQMVLSESAPEGLDGGEELAGFLFDAEAIGSIDELDLLSTAGAAWPTAVPVLLDTESKRANRQIVDGLTRRGAVVDEQRLPGLAVMLDEPNVSVPPREAIATITEWLTAVAGESAAAPTAVADGVGESLPLPGSIQERPFLVDGESGRLFGLSCEPEAAAADGEWAVIFNAGFVRHIGPNRMHVRWARAWARTGLPSIRVECRGVGESDGEDAPEKTLAELYSDGAVADGVAIVEALKERTGAGDLVLAGLCSGAYMAFHVALRVPGIRTVVLINPQILSYDEEEAALNRAVTVRRRLTSPEAWRALFTGGDVVQRSLSKVGPLLRALRSAVVLLARRGRSSKVDADWLISSLAKLQAAGVAVHLVMSAGDPGFVYLERHLGAELERAPKGALQLHVLANADHTFRPVESQDRLAKILDEIVLRDPQPAG